MSAPAIHQDPMLPLHAYLDDELDPANALAVEKRLADDPALAAACEQIETLRQVMRQRLPHEVPSRALRQRIEAAVGMSRRRARFAGAQFSWRALAASVALAAVMAGGSTSFLLAPSQADLAGPRILDAHIRSLMAPQPIDVASSDRHTVKPWFNGRIPQAPRVVDLAAHDFPLVGGRLDVIGETPVPTLVYRHRKHLISLTALPTAGRAAWGPSPSAAGGYNMYCWTQDGVTYWAVSDIGSADLDAFAELFRTTPPDQ